MRDLTPARMKCAMTIACPSVRQLDDGRLAIVGAMASEKEYAEYQMGAWLGVNEEIVIIDPALLANVWPGGETGGIHAIAPDNPYEPIDENYTKPDVINVPQ